MLLRISSGVMLLVLVVLGLVTALPWEHEMPHGLYLGYAIGKAVVAFALIVIAGWLVGGGGK